MTFIALDLPFIQGDRMQDSLSLESGMLEGNFSATVVAGKKLAEVVKDRKTNTSTYHTSEFLYAGR